MDSGKRNSFFSKSISVLVIGAMLGVATYSEESEAGFRRRFRGSQCLNRSCTVFINNPFQNALDSLLFGVGGGRFGRLSLLGHRRFLGGRSSALDRYIDLLLLQTVLNKRYYNPANPYPSLGIYSQLLRGEIGYLEPLDFASPGYAHKPRKFEPFQNGGDRAVGPNDRLPEPPEGASPFAPPSEPTNPSDGAPISPEELPSPLPSHEGALNAGVNSQRGRPNAPVTPATPVEPLSSSDRQASETFPEGVQDWRFQILENAVRRINAPSVFGRMRPNSALCARAMGHSQRLANESARSRRVIVHHRDLPGGLAEIVAASLSSSVSEAASQCVQSWIKSPPHNRIMFSRFREYCYAIVPVGNFYGCTGVFR